ncbi:hypothetical protein LguiB_027653 [Lonicera macranthoides]
MILSVPNQYLFQIVALIAKGTWVGMLTGTVIQTLVLFWIVYKTNWNKEVEKKYKESSSSLKWKDESKGSRVEAKLDTVDLGNDAPHLEIYLIDCLSALIVMTILSAHVGWATPDLLETVMHMLCDYPSSHQVWESLVPGSKWNWFFTFEYEAWLCSNIDDKTRITRVVDIEWEESLHGLHLYPMNGRWFRPPPGLMWSFFSFRSGTEGHERRVNGSS